VYTLEKTHDFIWGENMKIERRKRGNLSEKSEKDKRQRED
jgi:hypothetical protein